MLISEYNPEWINDFEKVKQKLTDTLAGLFVSVEHVGSTAVKGLAANPRIGIDLVYSKLLNLKTSKQAESIGYRHTGN